MIFGDSISMYAAAINYLKYTVKQSSYKFQDSEKIKGVNGQYKELSKK